MRRLFFFVLIVCSLFLPESVHAQGGTPPTPTPSLLELCLDEGTGACLTRAFEDGILLWAGIFLGALVIVAAYSQGWLEKIKEMGKEDGGSLVKRLGANDTTEQYLSKAIIKFLRFKFRGLPRHIAKNDANRLSLDQAYVSLRIFSGRIHKDKEDKAARKGGIENVLEMGKLEKSEAVELAEIMTKAENRYLAIIGIAGSGKSTLLQWAGLAAARAKMGEKLNEEQKRFIDALGTKPLPIFVPLRAYNEFCTQKKLRCSANSMLKFMVAHFNQEQSDISFDEEFFKLHLRKSALLMFDGVDEVEPEKRVVIRAAVESFIADYQHPQLFVLITSRPSAAYISDQMDAFNRAEVQRLEQKQRNDLIQFWHKAVFQDDPAQGERKAAQLITRIENAPYQVRDLATTPLMVTIFCMVSFSHELPRLRAKLYEDAIEVLLTDTIHHPEYNESLKTWGGIDWETRRNHLAFIAFTLQKKQVVSMLEDDLLDLIWEKFGLEKASAEKDARSFLRHTAERGGLLEAVDEHYGFFTHATFQEYLSGRYLGEEMDADEQKAFLQEEVGGNPRFMDDQWEESIRLTAGYLSIAGITRADRFINLLADLGADEKERARALTLAGFSLADMLPERRAALTVQKMAVDIQKELEVSPPIIPLQPRARLGLALGEIGDPRLASPLEPEMVTIQAGAFQMGTSAEEEKLLKEQEATVYDDEKPAHQVYLSEYEISKYPVTNFEFCAFYEAKGYEKEAFWSKQGWLWRTGEFDSDLSEFDEDTQKAFEDWLKRRPVEKRNQPFFWGDPKWDSPNLPVVGVTWFEAEAYVKWLGAETGLNYALPSEAQWERAARGPQNFLWSWGNAWDENKCNNYEPENKLGSTSPIGIYPHGTWKDGPHDMMGNVWEWCADIWQKDIYQDREGKESREPLGAENGNLRVLRGGSWGNSRSLARCAARYRFDPDDFDGDLGFRLVRLLLPS